MTFKEEVLAHYTDDELLETKDRDPTHWSSGNGLLFTGIFYTLLYKRREADAEDVKRFCKTVDSCWVRNEFNFPIFGLLNRNPNRKAHEAQDDYYGVMAASYFFNTSHARQVINYGCKNFWVYDNMNPNRLTWYGLTECLHYRFPGLVGFYRLCNRQSPGIIQAPLLASSITANAFASPEDSDSKIKTWLQIQVAKDRQQLNCIEAIAIWEERQKRDYGTLGNMFIGSFGEKHPFVKYNQT